MLNTTGQRGMRDIIGPAQNWPSGKKRRQPRGDSGQHPKFAKPRKHKQHTHPRDGSGQAFTLVGRNKKHVEPLVVRSGVVYSHRDVWLPAIERRVWLAGISAQRGY